MVDTIERLEKTAHYIKSRIGYTPEIAVILGSGLGKLADYIEESMEIPYEETPLPRTTVVGHEGKLISKH